MRSGDTGMKNSQFSIWIILCLVALLAEIAFLMLAGEGSGFRIGALVEILLAPTLILLVALIGKEVIVEWYEVAADLAGRRLFARLAVHLLVLVFVVVILGNVIVGLSGAFLELMGSQ